MNNPPYPPQGQQQPLRPGGYPPPPQHNQQDGGNYNNPAVGSGPMSTQFPGMDGSGGGYPPPSQYGGGGGYGNRGPPPPNQGGYPPSNNNGPPYSSAPNLGGAGGGPGGFMFSNSGPPPSMNAPYPPPNHQQQQLPYPPNNFNNRPPPPQHHSPYPPQNSNNGPPPQQGNGGGYPPRPPPNGGNFNNGPPPPPVNQNNNNRPPPPNYGAGPQPSSRPGTQNSPAAPGQAQQHLPKIEWVTVANRRIPPTALVAGLESGQPFYVGRAEYKGGLHPGTVHHKAKYCTIAYGGKAHEVEQFEVLCAPPSMVEWKQHEGKIDPRHLKWRPVQAGYEKKGGEPLYIGRKSKNGRDYIGKASASMKKGMCYAYDRKEKNTDEYLVLAHR